MLLCDDSSHLIYSCVSEMFILQPIFVGLKQKGKVPSKLILPSILACFGRFMGNSVDFSDSLQEEKCEKHNVVIDSNGNALVSLCLFWCFFLTYLPGAVGYIV